MQTPLANTILWMIVRVTPCPRIVADDAAVAAALQSVGRPVLLLVADGRLAEIDAPVRRDVEIVGEPQAGIVDHREPAAVRLVRELRHRLVGRDRIEAHAADADEQIALAVEGHAERMAADMGKDLMARVVGAEEADDVAVAGAAIEVVVAVENDVLGPFDLAKADDLDGPQLVVQRVRRGRIEGGRAAGEARDRRATHRPSTATCRGCAASACRRRRPRSARNPGPSS